MHLLSFFKKHWLVFLISLFLFMLPFFWLKTGEMDLGGDNNRLLFYDPITYLRSTNLYSVHTAGMGMVDSLYTEIPYVGLIALLKFFISSPTFAISFVNGLKLAVSFITIYLIVCEFIKKIYSENSKNISIAAMLAGIFYVVSLGSIHVSSEWGTALFTHNQVFVNPLIFYLIFKFILTNTYKYLCIALLISFIFSPNFSYGSAPPFFAFYPLAFLFLIIYVKFFLKNPIPWKGICIGFLLFLGVQAFHLLSQVPSFFDSSSDISLRVFDKSAVQREGINYFTAVSSNGMAILNLLLPSGNIFLRWISFIFPMVIIIGFILNKKKEFLFVSLFFLLTFFLVSANITQIGFEFYKSLFYMPAFSMFRVFFIKWMYVFLFFYSILFGLSAYNILLKLKFSYGKLFFLSVFALLVITGIPLFLGKPVNSNIVRGSDNVKSILKMDPRFEQTLQFIRSLPDDGKFLVMPLTDFSSQVIYGKDGGAYAGTPVLSRLTHKYGFYGYRDFRWRPSDPVLYAEDILKNSREKNYDRLLRIFTTLNIRYIFHNADPNIYEAKFSDGGPWYYYIKNSLPNTQQGYTDFIRQFPVRQIYKNGHYVIYEIDKVAYNPTIFIPDGIYESDKLSFDKNRVHSVFIDSSTCSKKELKRLCKDDYKPSLESVNFRMINPTLYEVAVRQKDPADTMLLVMQHAFHKGWKLIVDGKEISKNRHIRVNGYANGWLLTKKDLPDKQSYTLFIKLDPQKYFWYGSFITGVSLIAVIGLLMYSLIYKRN